jgi:hypothetical protein
LLNFRFRCTNGNIPEKQHFCVYAIEFNKGARLADLTRHQHRRGNSENVASYDRRFSALYTHQRSPIQPVTQDGRTGPRTAAL